MDKSPYHKIWSQLDLLIWFKITEQTGIPLRRQWEQSNPFPRLISEDAVQPLTTQIRLDIEKEE